MKARLITIYILSLLDLAFTLYLQAKFGEIEANPFGEMLLSNIVSAVFYKVVVVLIALLVLWHTRENKLTRTFSELILLVFVLLTMYHVGIISYTHYILFIR